MKSFRQVASAALAFALVAGLAQAQDWPSKPIRMVVPYPPGGPTDVMGRIVAAELSKATGQPVVVDNKPGASGQIGAQDVARAAGDGYTLLANASIHVINPHVLAKPLFDPLKEFTPVALAGTVPLVFVVPPTLPVRTPQEFVAWAKQNPGKVNFASSSTASAPHLAGEYLKQLTGIDMQHVPYKGSAPALADVAGGQVQMMLDPLPSAMPFIKGGKLRAIALSAPARVSAMPELPTMAESGFPGFDLGSWYGIWAPASTPRELVARINGEIVKAMRPAEVKERVQGLGAEPGALSAEAFNAFSRSEFERWGKIVRAAGVKLD